MNTFRLIAHHGFWSEWSSTPENPCRNSAVAACEAGRRPGSFCRKGYRGAGPRCAAQVKR